MKQAEICLTIEHNLLKNFCDTNQKLTAETVTIQCVMEKLHITTSVENFVVCMIDKLPKISQTLYTVQLVSKGI